MSDTEFNALVDVEVKEVSSVDEGANLRKFALFKRKETEMAKDVKDVKVEKAEEAPEEVQAQDTGADASEVFEALAKEKEALAKQLADAKAEAEELRKAKAEMEDAKLTEEYISKARVEFGSLPAEAEGVGKLLKNLHKADEVLATEVEGLLKTACEKLAEKDAAIEGGVLLEEVGVAGDPEPLSVYDEAMQKAKVLQDEHGWSLEKARGEVWRKYPDLYDRYKKEGK